MKEYITSGGLGDAYIIALKLSTINNPVKIYHKLDKSENRSSKINVILKWVECVKEVEFVNYDLDIPEVTTDPKDKNPSGINMRYFPRWFQDPIVKYWRNETERTYTVIQVNSGMKDGRNEKILKRGYLKEIIDKKERVILVGTHSKYEDIDSYKNLINSTNLEKVCHTVGQSSYFIGPEGFLSFVALSHKRFSTVYYTSQEAVNKRILGTPWERYVSDPIGNLIEDRKGKFIDSVLTK